MKKDREQIEFHKVVKSELLKLMKVTLKEYEENEHNLDRKKCSLCNTYLIDKHDWGPENCGSCPMGVFDGLGRSSVPCMNRKCYPIECEDHYSKDELDAVIEFYKQAIKVVKTMTAEQVQKEDAFKFLIEIDKEVFKQFDN